MEPNTSLNMTITFSFCDFALLSFNVKLTLSSRHSRKLELKFSPLKQIDGKFDPRYPITLLLFSSFVVVVDDTTAANAVRYLNEVVLEFTIQEVLSVAGEDGSLT